MNDSNYALSDVPWPSSAAMLRSRAAALGAAEALVDGEVRLSYAALAAAVGTAARAFIASGVAHGDRVAIWAPNIHEWVIAALGVHAVGGVLVPLNTRFKGAEAADILRRSGACMLLTVRGFLDTDYVQMLRAESVPDLQGIVILRGDAGGETSWQQFLERAESVSVVEADRREAAVVPDDLSDIMYTSGTTGRPKGAMLTHRQMLRTYVAVTDLLGIREGDRYLIISPFFHNFGYKFGFITALIAGGTAVPLAVFDVPALFDIVERERIAFLPGPPTLFHSMLDHPDRHRRELSSLRLTLVGAASVPAELIRRLREELPFKTIITGYGLTETTGVGSICRQGDSDDTIAGTSGRVFPGTELKVADDAGAEQPRGERGEVWIRGFTVMRGYLDDPAQTAAAITPDGWLRTGDIGVMDEAGNLRIVDRLKDMFIVGGFNAYPAEIEGLMLANAKVAQVAVVGAPEPRLGEVGIAFVQLRSGCSASESELIEWCRAHMANYKAPRRIEFVDALPLNATGKVLKYVLKERALKMAAHATC